MPESCFFQDLSILMFIAGVVAAVFARFGWPKVIGYILAGILMSEYTWGGSFLANPQSVQIIGQLGIVFLMFGMGLSFSVKEMKKIKSVAVPAAVFDTVVMVGLGYFVGSKCFGWSKVQSLFLGVAICDSATTMLAKVIDEMGWGRRLFTKYALGTSVCEDLVTVGLIAIATGFACGDGLSAGALFASLGWLGVFFLTVLVFGFVFVPRLLQSVGKRKDDESLLLTILGSCFLVSFIADKFQFSLAIGAFLVGFIGSTSCEFRRLEELVNPLKSMFSAVFFVSIGLLVDPVEIGRHLPAILLVSSVIVIGKFVNITLASLATGVDIKTSVQNGLCLAQVGEFAFMVAILCASLCPNGTGSMFEIAIGASLLTTLLNPLLIKMSEPIGVFVAHKTPERIRRNLMTYQAWLEKIRSSDDSPAYLLLRAAAIKLGVYAVLMLSVSVVCALLYKFDFSRFSTFFERHDSIFFFLLANIFCVALMPMVISASQALADEIAELLAGDGSAKWQLSIRQMIRFVSLVAVVSLFFVEWSVINVVVLPVSVRLQGASVVVVAGVGIFGWRFFVKAGRRATQRFQEALTAEERREGLVRMTTISVPEGTIHKFRLGEHSPAVGETVLTLDIRARTGASVVAVHRDNAILRNVGPSCEFRAGDILVALGDPQQIAALGDILKAT